MSLAGDLLPALSAARSIAGSLGLRQYRVYIRSGAWSGTYTGDGSETATETELLENGQSPKVRFAGDDQIALGAAVKGSAKIGPITPSHAAGGTAIALLEGSSLADGSTLHVRLRHSDGSDQILRVTNVGKDSSLHYTLECDPVE